MGFFLNKRFVILAALLTAGVALISCGNSEVSTQEQTNKETEKEPKELVKWRHGVIAFKGDSGFQLMAKEKGFFEKHGVDVEFVEFEADSTMVQALVAGEIDSMEGTPSGVINAIEEGANLKFIGSTISGLPFALFVNKDIDSIEDLEGKNIGVSKPGSLPDIIVKAILDEVGMDPESVNLVNAGNDSQTYQALVAGQIDATATTTQFAPRVKEDGVKILAYVNDVLPNYLRFVIAANEDSLKENKDTAVGFLAAVIEGLNYALDHKDETLKLTAKTIGIEEDDETIVSLYDEIKDKGYISTDIEIPYEKLEWMKDLLVKLERIKGDVDVSDMIDGSYREEALKIADLEQ